jgi:hypothetical protein
MFVLVWVVSGYPWLNVKLLIAGARYLTLFFYFGIFYFLSLMLNISRGGVYFVVF